MASCSDLSPLGPVGSGGQKTRPRKISGWAGRAFQAEGAARVKASCVGGGCSTQSGPQRLSFEEAAPLLQNSGMGGQDENSLPSSGTPSPRVPGQRCAFQGELGLGLGGFFLPTALSLLFLILLEKKKTKNKKSLLLSPPPTAAGRNFTWQRAQVSTLPCCPVPSATWPNQGPSEDGMPRPGHGGRLPRLPLQEGSRAVPGTPGPLRGSALHPPSLSQSSSVQHWGFPGRELWEQGAGALSGGEGWPGSSELGRGLRPLHTSAHSHGPGPERF